MLHWNADPTAFSLGPVAVRWYGIFFAVAFWQGLVFMRRAYARAGYDPGEADRLFGYIVIGVVVGARLGHCLIYEPLLRSEERRVGKECRSRWSPYH